MMLKKSTSTDWRRELGYDAEAPFFKGDDPKCDNLFRGDAKSAAARNRFAPFRQGKVEVFPGVFSWDADYLRFLDLVSVRMSNHPDLQIDVDDAGRVGPSGVRSNFYGLRHVTGAPMIPATYVLADNTKKRADKNLIDGPLNEKHEWLFRAVVRLFFSDLENVGLKIARGTSTGVSAFQKTMSSKLAIAKAALKNAPVAGEHIIKGEFKEAFELYDFGGAFFVVYREQTTDGVSKEKDGSFTAKPREVADLLYAITGGTKGRLFPSSKDPSDLAEQGVKAPKGFFRTRRRTAMGAPFTMNASMMVVAQSIRKKIYDVYEFTTHHTTRLQKADKVKPFGMVIATDVSDHDTFWPGWFVDLMCDELHKMGYAEWWIEIFRASLRLPVYVSAPSPDEDQNHILIGDPDDPRMNVGLPSGHGFTDVLGTMNMIICYLIMQIDHTADYLWNEITSFEAACDFLHRYMQGKMEIAQMSKSDDAFLLWRRGPAMAKAIALQQRLIDGDESVSPYMLIGYEKGGAFLGDLLVYDHTKDLANARFVGNIVSYVQNMLCPEYSIDTHKPDRGKRQRPFPGLAVAAAPLVFGSAPGWDAVNQILEESWFEVYGESFRAMRNKMAEDDTKALREWLLQREDLKGFGNLSPTDLEVLEEPSKLGWKYSEIDLNPQVVEMVSSGLTPDETEEYFNSIVPAPLRAKQSYQGAQHA